MSARASGQVWKLSRHKGSELLVLLAIADNAKDDGRDAWPSIPELARKTRLTERNIQIVLRKLERSGELIIQKNAGPNRANLYHIVLNGEKIAPPHPEKFAPSNGEEIAPVKSFQGEIQRTQTVKSSVLSEEIPPTPPYKEELIKLTVIEPSSGERARKNVTPPVVRLADFTPSAAQIADAVGYGVPQEQIAFQTEQWRDYHAERGTAIKDFGASWRRWMRNAPGFERPRVGAAVNGRASPAARAEPRSFDAIKRDESRRGMAEWNAQMDEEEHGTDHLQSRNGTAQRRVQPGAGHAAAGYVLGPGEKS